MVLEILTITKEDLEFRLCQLISDLDFEINEQFVRMYLCSTNHVT